MLNLRTGEVVIFEIGGIFAAKVDYIPNAFDEPDIMHVKQLHSTTSCNTN